MSLLWAVAPVVAAGGALMVLLQLQGMGDAATDLQVELRRCAEVRLAVAEVRSVSADARATARGLRRA